MSDITIEDIKSYLQGRAKHPIMSVSGIDDPDYKTMRDFVRRVKPNTEDYMHSITSGMNSMLSGMRHMEQADYDRIVNIFKKYEVKGTSGGITGKRMYGYDRSRVDGKMIRRGRQN
tara:strand:- start:944 stop:1291 length:348 start_codon:yes stop_codon:yes gene_type:complete